MRKYNETLIELWIGILFFSAICQLAGIWFVKDKLSYSLGLWLGAFTACLVARHLARSIERMLSGAASGDTGRGMRISTLLRYGMVIIVLAGACMIPHINPISTFIGIMGLKVAAYLQPFTHKWSSKICGKNRKEDDTKEKK